MFGLLKRYRWDVPKTQSIKYPRGSEDNGSDIYYPVVFGTGCFMVQLNRCPLLRRWSSSDFVVYMKTFINKDVVRRHSFCSS